VFQHVKDFGHAALKEDVAEPNNPPQTAQKMSKKDRKKKKNADSVRRNDYRF
jgi:hypothetical protein